jgi:toluene monooxygenase system ferredoxin subunit
MSRTLVCNTSEIPDNGMKGCDVGGRRVLIAKSGDRFYAYQGLCPHQEVCLDEGFYDGSVLTCHQHLWQWNITTGEPVGLAEAPLERYDVEVDNGALYVLDASALQACEIFAGISDATLGQLNAIARREEHESGSSLYDLGDIADDVFVLESGRIEFLIGREGHATAAGFMLRRGEIFGWNAMLSQQPSRIARAVCLEKSTVLGLNGKETLRILEADPASGFQVMRKLLNVVARYLTPPGAE